MADRDDPEQVLRLALVPVRGRHERADRRVRRPPSSGSAGARAGRGRVGRIDHGLDGQPVAADGALVEPDEHDEPAARPSTSSATRGPSAAGATRLDRARAASTLVSSGLSHGRRRGRPRPARAPPRAATASRARATTTTASGSARSRRPRARPRSGAPTRRPPCSAPRAAADRHAHRRGTGAPRPPARGSPPRAPRGEPQPVWTPPKRIAISATKMPDGGRPASTSAATRSARPSAGDRARLPREPADPAAAPLGDEPRRRRGRPSTWRARG